MIVVTGKTGVGKTTILKHSKLENVIYLDEVIKDVFYKRNFKLYWDIKQKFGNEYVSYRKVNTTKLGKLVFSNDEKLNLLNDLVTPYIQAYLETLKVLEIDYIVEMAIYINFESIYKKYFDKVILIDRKINLDSKFNYLDKKENPILNNKIKHDLLINEENLDNATESLIDFINKNKNKYN